MLKTKPRLNQFFVVESSDVTLATPVPASTEPALLRVLLLRLLEVYTRDHAVNKAAFERILHCEEL